MEMLGEKIKEIRKRRNFSQEELGKLIGVQKAQVSKLGKWKKQCDFSNHKQNIPGNAGKSKVTY